MKNRKLFLIFSALGLTFNLMSQVQLTATLTGGNGTNAFTLSYPGNMNRYETGQLITFVSSSIAGTIGSGTPTTININGLGIKNIFNTAMNNLATGDIKAGQEVTIVYDGTEFQMTSVSGNTLAGAGNGWLITGNGGTNSTINFIGTTDNNDLIFKRNNVISGFLNNALGNTGFGVFSLPNTSGGQFNTAIGNQALFANSVGSNNTALGFQALFSNATGSNNIGIGYQANVASGNLTNAIAIGFQSSVSASNSMVLGGTGVNAVRVGIGLTSPASALHAAGTISAGIPFGGMGGAIATNGSMVFYNANSVNTATIQTGNTITSYTLTLPTIQGPVGSYLQNNGAGGLSWGTPAGGLSGGTTNYVAKWTTPTSLSSTSLIFDNGTNVGIGTAAPTELLEVNGGSFAVTQSANDPVVITRTGTVNQLLTMGWSTLGGNYGYIQGGTWGGTTAPLILEGGGGNVGIGTTNPTYTLDVVGRLKTTGVNETSDARFKTHVVTLSHALDKVSKLRGVNFLWDIKNYPDRNFESKLEMGLIAQEVEKIVPEVVLTDKEGYKSIEYSKLVGLLIEAIKEQQEKIQIIENENATLKQQSATRDIQSNCEMTALKAQMADLKTAIDILLKLNGQAGK